MTLTLNTFQNGIRSQISYYSDDKEQNQGSFHGSHAVLNLFFMAISNTINYNINAKDINDLTWDMIS